ncbi:MAG: hypothetical protein HC921_12105 [Synechococcaceae cyanobacterium SM2_3_1]|nr:hypothetical protein [Synechococcaceae cyanobacterium SM2_3_1]
MALATTFEPGRAAAWGLVGQAGAVAIIAVGAALQAVDGVAFKVMVDRWAAATGEARMFSFEATFAVRQIEIGFASLLSLLSGFTLIVFGVSIVLSSHYPLWMGWLGLLSGLGLVVTGAVQASTGFSALAMTISMLASSVFLIWAILVGILMWRLAPRLVVNNDAA